VRNIRELSDRKSHAFTLKDLEIDFMLLRAASPQIICHFIPEAVLKSLSFHICGLKMFRTVFFCLCFCRLDGEF